VPLSPPAIAALREFIETVRPSLASKSGDHVASISKPLCYGRYRVPEGSDIGDSRLRVSAEWFVSRYDEAIVSFLVSAMNSIRRSCCKHSAFQ
jgi:hypothetical protein